MDNKNYFGTDEGFFVDGQANNSNGFRIYGRADKDTSVVENTISSPSQKNTVQKSDSEFSIPENSQNVFSESNYVQTPSSIRPTYLPRFTEVSENYRMQNDPRPRPKNDSHTVVKENIAETAELDPTTEKLEEREVKKTVVTSAVIRNPEPVDESLTVIKFSTPDYDEEEPAFVQPESVQTVVESTLPEEELCESEEENVEELIVETPAEEKPRNMTIPDPEQNYNVVEFRGKNGVVAFIPPRGSSNSDNEEKRRGEFENAHQRDSIKDRFLDILMSVRVRLAVSILLLLAMVGIDCLPYLGVNPLDWMGLGSVSVAKAVIDLQFSVCIFLFALPEVLKAFGLLAKGKLAPELFVAVSLPLILVNDIVIINAKATNYLTFGVLYGFTCLVTVIASYNKTSGDFTSFKLVSRNVTKNVLDKQLTRDLPYENIALDGVVDEYNSKTARMFRTAFVPNFFKRSSESCENSSNVLTMIGVGLGVSAVSGVLAYFVSGYSFIAGIQVATFVLTLSLPSFSLLLHKLSYKHACENAAAEESAFVGESSIYDGADVDVFTYKDTEIFGIEDVSLRKVHLYGNVGNTEKAMKQMCSLFTVVGGPLDFLFSAAFAQRRAEADNVLIEENGISGTLDGHSICAGTEEYMKARGISIPDSDYRTNPPSTDSTRIMYGAEDGEVYVKFFIRYSFSEEFTMLLPELKNKKIVPLIYTRDPNITNSLLKILTHGEDIIRVMKINSHPDEEETLFRRIDSGIVTHGDKGNAINMVLLAKKYTAFQESFAAIELISTIVSAVLAVVLTIGEMLTLPATLLAVWQIVWCIVIAVRSKRHFRYDTEREEEIYEQ